jgi:hypothetical protein
MQRPFRKRFVLILATAALAVVLPGSMIAQDEDSTPLGDVARSLRKKSSQEVIDNDNLTQVMDEVESHRLTGASLRFSIEGITKIFHVSAPDVTCSLSFTANARALLSSQYVQLDLPPDDLGRLEGPATIQDGSLQVTIFNGTDWHVSELDVALTLLKRKEVSEKSPDPGLPAPDSTAVDETHAGSGSVPASHVSAAAMNPAQAPESRREKRSDLTILYKMRAAAGPSETAVFTAPLNVEIAADQEWHWAIMQAKGYPPQRSQDVSQSVPASPLLLPTSPEFSQILPANANPVVPDSPTR